MSSPSFLARLERVSFSHPGGPPLLCDVDLVFSRGVTAVIGDNGAGKSTLLSLLRGDAVPTNGRVVVAGHVAGTPQDVDAPPRDVHLVDPRIHARLGLDDDVLARWAVASPGERRRWQIAVAWAAAPDVLLLDEPTNHLDEPTARTVKAMLAGFRGAVVLVSHDRALVDALAVRTVRLHGGRALVTNGGVAASLAAFEAEQHARRAARAQLRSAVSDSRQLLGAARHTRAESERDRSTRHRMRNPGDNDARGLLAQHRVDRASGKHARDVSRARTRLAQAEAAFAAGPALDKEVGGDIFVGFTPLRRPHVCLAPVLVARDERVHVTGSNGAGKSTLLRAIVAGANLGPALFHLPQELTPDEERAALQAYLTLPRDERGKAGQLLAALGTDPARLQASAHPSAGEARKLALVSALATGAQALVLDEPTSHLDLPTVARLERALAGYPGALVFVTHDEAFAAALAPQKTLAPPFPPAGDS